MAKAKGNLSLAQTFPDLVILPLAAWALLPSRWIDRHGRILVAGSAALWGAIAFGPFNPLQSAWPIFNRETTPLVRVRRPGATQPRPSARRRSFRGDAERLGLPLGRPCASRAADGALAGAFARDGSRRAQLDIQSLRTHLADRGGPASHPGRLAEPDTGAMGEARGSAHRSGRRHAHRSDGVPSAPRRSLRRPGRRRRTTHVFGWAPWTGLADDQRLTVYGDSRLRPVRFSRIPRPDVAKALSDPALAYSGFELVFAPPAGGAGDVGAPICMVAAGTSNGVPALIVEDSGPCEPGARPVAVAR